jgi:four helix bundle protein
MKEKENTEKLIIQNNKRKFDLQERFIDYAVRIIKASEKLPETKAGKHICSQILRSGTSPAPNYGEAQSAESPADFIHKLKIALKELRETEIWLKIIIRTELIKPSKLSPLLGETDELISILFKSIQTAKKNKES